MYCHNWTIEIYTFVKNLQSTKHPSYVKISKAKYLLQYIVGFLKSNEINLYLG